MTKSPTPILDENALRQAFNACGDYVDWSEATDARYKAMVRTIIRAYLAHVQAPGIADGWALMPLVPALAMLRVLANVKWPEDWEAGKKLQAQLSSDAIPFQTEYEVAAGQYLRLLAARPVSPAASWQSKIHAFAKAILHGDEKHRAWLLDAANAFCEGHPVPTLSPVAHAAPGLTVRWEDGWSQGDEVLGWYAFVGLIPFGNVAKIADNDWRATGYDNQQLGKFPTKPEAMAAVATEAITALTQDGGGK